ncbi:polymorphic toxin type 27 domain-containing protein [Actinoplanes utahensis]|uniref:Bacterial toxin 27 domain-containing protein n=1 Tax=Actinoplanes utahensis TaxID=1869 RepID=A0A0A6UR70_ACTUT|nr:polymorphic toxin type 27 domain-containing protein [Actinoplanes utahensis]KHD77538.1 hypothetical protein MB27_10600 [Actinoplanes utahensis]GIF32707.1 hypothetical protein Aut01nite_56930 [Actinoplanes utahensis]
MTRTLRGIGDFGTVDVCAFVSGGEPDHETVAYLRSGTPFVWSTSLSPCLLCGRRTSTAVLTDGERYVWPESLIHYVGEHGVRLPVSLRGTPGPVDADRFAEGLLTTGEVTIDDDWWSAQRRDAVRHLPGCPRSPVRCSWQLPRNADIWVDGVWPGDVATMARLRRLFGAAWPFSELHARIADQPFRVAVNGDPVALNRESGLRDHLFYGAPGALLPVTTDV